MDEQVDRLLAGLRERDVLESAVLVVTSDHGETLLEHTSAFGHGMLVDQGSMRAVWLIRLPDGRQAGSRIDGPVASIDVLPTVLPLLGLPVPSDLDGESIPITQDEIPARGPRFGQATQPPRVEGDHAWPNAEKARFVRDGRFKLIQTPYLGTEELYDLDADPAEHRNLLKDAGPQEAALAQRLRGLLEAWAASAQPLAVRRSTLDLEAIERLKALGYLED
jgi:arylsulfatase A-like enzyme